MIDPLIPAAKIIFFVLCWVGLVLGLLCIKFRSLTYLLYYHATYTHFFGIIFPSPYV